MNTARSFALKASVAVGLLLAGHQSFAGFVGLPTTLDQLTPAGNFTIVGDKTFTFLSYASATIDSHAVVVTALTQSINGIVTPYGFQLSDSFSASGVNASSDVAINFTVMSSGAPITAVNLFSNGSTTGSGVTDVSESVFALTAQGGQGAFITQLSVNGNGSASANLTQFNPAGYSGLFITKNIDAFTGASGGSATISIVQQTFPQGVPEPSSIAMMGLGICLAGGFAVARSRRKDVAA